MDPNHNFDSSQSTIYNSFVTYDDGQKGGQAHQMIPLSATSTQPPCAEIQHPTESDQFRQAEIPIQTTEHYYGHSSREHTPFDSQSDESETSFSSSSATTHSISPAPHVSHAFKTRHSFLRHNPRRPSSSQSSPIAQEGQLQDRSSAHSQASASSSSQLCVPPPAVQGRRHISATDPYATIHPSTLTVSGESHSAQPILFPVPIITASFTPPGPRDQVPVSELAVTPGFSNLKMRSSEVDNGFDVQNAQDSRTQYSVEYRGPIPNLYKPNDEWSGSSPATSGTQYPSAGPAYANMIPGMSSSRTHCGPLDYGDTSSLQDDLPGPHPSQAGAPPDIGGHNLPQQSISSIAVEAPKKQHRTGERKHPTLGNQQIPSAYLPFPGRPGPPQATSSAQHPSAGSSYMAPELSPHTHQDVVTSLPVMNSNSVPSPSSSGLQDDLYGNDDNASPLLGSASNGGPSRIECYSLSQRDTLPTVSGARRGTVRRPGIRKRKDNPKDKKAAERLRDQRQTDDEYIQMLYNTFVPKSEGTVAKKDRLSLRFEGLQDSTMQRSTALDYRLDRRSRDTSAYQS